MRRGARSSLDWVFSLTRRFYPAPAGINVTNTTGLRQEVVSSKHTTSYLPGERRRSRRERFLLPTHGSTESRHGLAYTFWPSQGAVLKRWL